MGREAERQTIMGRMKTVLKPDWGPAQWPNVEFKPPNDGRWLSSQIVELGTDRKSLGKNNFLKRSLGILQVDVYCPKNFGSAENRLVTDFLEDHFDSLELFTDDFEVIVFATPESRDLGGSFANGSSPWYRRVFEAHYHRDSTVRK